jgi:hypothetical protein
LQCKLQYDVSKKAELDSVFTNFLSGVLNAMRRCTTHEGTTFFVELLEEFPRLIQAKLRLKIEDNRLHSNGKVKLR